MWGVGSEGSDSDGHLIGDDSKGKIVDHGSGCLSPKYLGCDVIGCAEEGVMSFVLAVYYELAEVEIS